jgi:hypothetical protein
LLKYLFESHNKCLFVVFNKFNTIFEPIIYCVHLYVIVPITASRNLNSWLGATDIDDEGLFVWEDGSEVAKYFKNWADGEPSNSDGKEHCVFISANSLKWNDYLCNEAGSSVCEFD